MEFDKALKDCRKGIYFTAQNGQAIFEGRKTQTRRLVGRYIDVDLLTKVISNPAHPAIVYALTRLSQKYFAKGDLLYVREPVWIAKKNFSDRYGSNIQDPDGDWRTVGFDGDMDEDSRDIAREYGVRRSPSIHMPRWVSRSVVKVTDVRLERLNDISSEDAISEGILKSSNHWETKYRPDIDRYTWTETPEESFEQLWLRIHGIGSWDKNPIVGVFTFELVSSRHLR